MCWYEKSRGSTSSPCSHTLLHPQLLNTIMARRSTPKPGPKAIKAAKLELERLQHALDELSKSVTWVDVTAKRNKHVSELLAISAQALASAVVEIQTFIQDHE